MRYILVKNYSAHINGFYYAQKVKFIEEIKWVFFELINGKNRKNLSKEIIKGDNFMYSPKKDVT